MIWLAPLVLVPSLAAVAVLLTGERSATPRVLVGACAATLVLALLLAGRVLAAGPLEAAGGWLRADALSALVACMVAAVALACAAYGIPYRAALAAEGHDAPATPGRHEALFFALLACLLLAAMADNLALLWVAIEGATIASALLVADRRHPGAAQAGWKQLLFGSVALTLALFATVLLFSSAAHVLGEGAPTLSGSALRAGAARLDPRFVRLAFVFALAGFGALAGLAPMHAWLPDALAEAPTPVAALASTGLLATALVALLRFHAIAAACVGPSWSGGLLVVFGALSMIVAVPFMLVQGEFKRLLAYSSIQHAGFVALAVGLGAPLAVFGAMLHLLVHSLARALAFLAGGSVARASGSERMDHWAGLLASSPGLGVLFVGAGLGLAGLPPAGTFVSQWLALTGAVTAAHPAAAVIAILALAIVFTGLAYHVTRVVLGRPRPEWNARLAPLTHAPLWALLALLVLFGLWLPAPVRALVEQAAKVVRP